MVTPLVRLQQIADEIRHLPIVFEDDASGLMGTCGELVDEAIKLGAFAGKEYVTFRVTVTDRKILAERTAPKSWRNYVFVAAANYFAPILYAKPGGEKLVCGPIADAIEREIRRLEIETAPDTPQHTGKPGQRRPRHRRQRNRLSKASVLSSLVVANNRWWITSGNPF
jgi:hypothetical protein